jgi:BirA family biotin operon repressor/biotin-[acetyl-CoA-carboxylase] ligase
VSEIPHDIAPQRIQAALSTRVYGRSLQVVGSTGSTNDDARTAASRNAARGHVIVADTQTQGRGAHGRVWLSPPGVDLYLSIVERLEVPKEKLAPLSLAVGLGVSDAIKAVAEALDPKVKWPNDVWLGRRKTAGILVEVTSLGASIETITIGIGLCVNRIELEPEIARSATSLLKDTRLTKGDAPSFDRALVLAELLRHVEVWVDAFARDGIAALLDPLRHRLALRGEEVQCGDERGILVGIAKTGALQLETKTGLRDIISGTLRPVE